MIEDVDVAVVGGGVTGLTSAYTLLRQNPELRLRLLEGRERLGGNIQTEHVEGHLIDAGPDSFLRTKPHATELCRELGLETEFLTTRTEARSAFIAHRGKLERMPAGMVLAVPTRLGPMLKTPVLSFGSKLRVLADVFVRRRRAPEDESIAAFLTRRFGAEAASRIGAPLLGGIYAGDVATLSIRATFPQLAELEDRYGSVIYGLFATQAGPASSHGEARSENRLVRTRELWRWMQREAAHAPSPFLSLRGGLGLIIDELRDRLPEGAVRLSSPVEQIERDGASFIVKARGVALRARAVILCAPAHAAARMLPQGKLASELSAIPYVSTATVFLAFSERTVQRKLDGVGFIVPPGESELLAGTWVSSKWEARAPRGSVLMRGFFGGARDPRVLDRSDTELMELAHRELERLMGPLGTPQFGRVYRYVDSSPQPTVGHPARLERIRAELRTQPGLFLAGAAYDGVGIPDCVRQARAAAESVRRHFGLTDPSQRALAESTAG